MSWLETSACFHPPPGGGGSWCSFVSRYHSPLLEINLAIALGVFGQTLGVLGKSIKALSPDTGHIKDDCLATDGG